MERPGDIRALFFDIDGTLVSFATHRVPATAEEAIRRARAAGVRAFIATGRMLPMLGVVAHIPFDGYIAYNGACCTDAAGREIYCNPLPKEELERLLHRLDESPFPVAFMGRREMTVNYRDERVLALARQIDVEPPRVEDPRITIRRDIFQLCLYVGPDEERRILTKTLPLCASSRWNPGFADVNLRGDTKQSGMDHLLAHYGIPPAATMAFGDGGNDIPMLRHAAVGVAMGNAGDEVKRAADYVTAGVDDDGVLLALRRFGVAGA